MYGSEQSVREYSLLLLYTSTIISNHVLQKENYQAYLDIIFNTRNFHLENPELPETRSFFM
jgi:hypothetical protein